jgi:hypothetical protein
MEIWAASSIGTISRWFAPVFLRVLLGSARESLIENFRYLKTVS